MVLMYLSRIFTGDSSELKTRLFNQHKRGTLFVSAKTCKRELPSLLLYWPVSSRLNFKLQLQHQVYSALSFLYMALTTEIQQKTKRVANMFFLLFKKAKLEEIFSQQHILEKDDPFDNYCCHHHHHHYYYYYYYYHYFEIMTGSCLSNSF